MCDNSNRLQPSTALRGQHLAVSTGRAFQGMPDRNRPRSFDAAPLRRRLHAAACSASLGVRSGFKRLPALNALATPACPPVAGPASCAMAGVISEEGDFYKARSRQGRRVQPTRAKDRPGKAVPRGALPDAPAPHLSPSALQVSFPFRGQQHEVHSLCSLADANHVVIALTGKSRPISGHRPSLLPGRAFTALTG